MSETNEYTVAAGPAKGAHVKCTVTEGPPSGREMDAWIAERVFQVPLPKSKPDYALVSGNRIWFSHASVKGGYEWVARPYSTDMNAALEAEGRVPSDLRPLYILNLDSVLEDVEGDLFWSRLRRTPAQICEAIWMTMEGKREG